MKREVYEKLLKELAHVHAKIYDEGSKEGDQRKISFANGISYVLCGMDVIYNQTWDKLTEELKG